jgi:hypothetical protein
VRQIGQRIEQRERRREGEKERKKGRRNEGYIQKRKRKNLRATLRLVKTERRVRGPLELNQASV